jgi:hypothetical protein
MSDSQEEAYAKATDEASCRLIAASPPGKKVKAPEF